MKIYSSAIRKGFFPSDLYTTFPDDSIELTTEEYNTLINGQSTGKTIVFPSTGKPYLQDPEELITLSQIKESRKAFINRERERVLSEGVEFGGVLYDCDDQAKTDVTGVITGITAGVALPDEFSWRSKDNLNIPMEEEDVLYLGQTILSYRFLIMKQSWDLKDHIDSLNTKSAVQAVTWETNI